MADDIHWSPKDRDNLEVSGEGAETKQTEDMAPLVKFLPNTHEPFIYSPAPHKLCRVVHACALSTQKWGQRASQDFRVILSNTEILRSTWTTWYLVSKRKKNRTKILHFFRMNISKEGRLRASRGGDCPHVCRFTSPSLELGYMELRYQAEDMCL